MFVRPSSRSTRAGVTASPSAHVHTDCSYSISTQLFGRKRWYLFPPSCTAALQVLLKQAEWDGTSVNCDNWEEERKAEYRRRGMLVAEQKVGESIFMCVRLARPLSFPFVRKKTDPLNDPAVPPDGTTRCTTSRTRPSR